jgi:DNA-binding response OmpR family regulator
MKKVTMSDLIQLQKVGTDKQILYIDSDQKLQKSFGVYLKKTFQKVHQAFDTKQGLELFIKYKPQVVVMELEFDEEGVLELIDDIKSKSSNTIIITLSEENDLYDLLQNIDMGICEMLLKPIPFPKLATVLTKVLPKPVVKKKQPLPKKQEPVVNKKVLAKEKSAEISIEKPKEKPTVQIKEEKQEQKTQKPKVQELKKTEEPKSVEPVKPIPQKTQKEQCYELLEGIARLQEPVEVINAYKGIIIRNYGGVVSCHKNDYFIIQVGLSQIIAAKLEKYVVLRTEKNQYIHATLKQLDIKSGSLILTNPYFLDYKQRDKNYTRFKADKSCKASVYLEKHRVDFSVDYLSFKSAELVTTNTKLHFKVEDQFDLTLGFDLSGPNKMIQEKKFTKVFAKCEVLRIDHHRSNQKIVVLMQVKKADERTLLRYLQQREEEITSEFKSIIRR